MKKIQLNRRKKRKYNGFFALVDNEDFKILDQYDWHIKIGRNAKYVANNNLPEMHRFIMNAKPGQQVDHIDGNGLNNQKSNLRICTNSQNQMNKKSSGTSKYLGVSLYKTKSKVSLIEKIKWLCHIKNNGKQIHIGYFETEKEAAIAYNKAALKYHGEFARLNKIFI